MANTSTQHQTNGANNTLTLVSSSLIPLSSASSVNSSLASHSQPSLLAAQNQLAQQQSLFHLYHDPFQFPQLYQQQPHSLFLPGSLAAMQAPNHLQTAAQTAIANEQLAKKKVNKQLKILSKSAGSSGNQQQLQKASGLGLKSNMLAGHQPQFATQNNQAVVIPLPNMMSNSQQQQAAMAANKKLIQNNALAQQSALVNSQFKSQLHNSSPAQLLAQQSPLMNQAQLIAPLQQIPQSPLAWTTQPNPNQLVPGQPHQIFIRQQHPAADAGGVFIQNSNPAALQTMPGTPIYVNHNAGMPGIMQLVPNHSSNLNSVPQPILANSSSSNSASSTPNSSSHQQSSSKPASGSSGTKLKAIKPAQQSLNASLSSQSCSQSCSQSLKTVKMPIMSNGSSKEDGSLKKLSKKQQQALEQEKAAASAKFSTKSTQQMNAELMAMNEKNQKAQRSDSIKSLDSTKSKSDGKLKKQSSSLDEDSSSSMNSKSNGSLFKKDKLEKKVKQKAIVKPQVLFHCVEGYIISESSSPFPVNVTEELNDELQQIKLNNERRPSLELGLTAKELLEKNSLPALAAGKGKIKSKKLKKLKLKSAQQTPAKLASSAISCAESIQSNQVSNESNLVENNNKKNLELSKSVDESPSFPSAVASTSGGLKERKSISVVSVAPISETNPRPSTSKMDADELEELNVYRWSVEEVYEYIIKEDFAEAIAKELRKAQIDGKALVLLTIPILKDHFNFKLGPTLSLKNKIEELKGRSGSDESLASYLPPSGANIYKWSVRDTYQFILNLSCSTQYADEFEKQEMDGYSLTLINLDNIIGDMNIPYGPALVIYNKIEALKQSSTNS